MRQLELIENALPCDNDYADKTMQTIADAKEKGSVRCSNWDECKKRSKRDSIMCPLKLGVQMAAYVMKSRSRNFEEAIEKEKELLEKEIPFTKFWVRRNDKWSVIENIEDAMDYTANFARVVIDAQPDEHIAPKPRFPGIDLRSNSMRKRSPEMGPKDALHNAVVDIQEDIEDLGYLKRKK